MIIIHPKKLKLFQNSIATILFTSIPVLVFLLDSEKKLSIKSTFDFISIFIIMIIYIGVIYQFWNPKFLSFEKTIFNEIKSEKEYSVNNHFMIDDFKIELINDQINLLRFEKIKATIDSKSKTLVNKPFPLLKIYTKIDLNEIENFDVVFRTKKRNILIYNTKFNENFELKTLNLDPLSFKNKYPERKKEAKKIVDYLNSLL